MKPQFSEAISIHISRSSMTTEVNKTGSWRFVRPKFEEKTAPCSAACPAGEDIARIEMLAGQGLLQTALETILLENPFPAVCGRVCFHPCEKVCNRAELDEAMAVEEGVEIMELAAPVKLALKDGELVVTLQDMKISGMQTSNHRARVMPRGEAKRYLRVDKIFSAIGAEALESWQPTASLTPPPPALLSPKI